MGRIERDIKDADQGDVEAQYNMGLRYGYGVAIGLNLAKSLYYLQQAAAGGHPNAEEVIKDLGLLETY